MSQKSLARAFYLIGQGLSPKQVAEQTGYGPDYVRAAAKKAGIPFASDVVLPDPQILRNHIVLLAKEQKNAKEIASIAGCNESTVYKITKANGIPLVPIVRQTIVPDEDIIRLIADGHYLKHITTTLAVSRLRVLALAKHHALVIQKKPAIVSMTVQVCSVCGKEFHQAIYKRRANCSPVCVAEARARKLRSSLSEQEQRAKQAQYFRDFCERNPDYFRQYHRDWKKKNPELYLARQRRYRANNREEYNRRQREYRQKFRGVVEILPPASGHEVFDNARSLVNRLIGRSFSYGSSEPPEDYYDMISEALLAQVEGRDPEAAVRSYAKQANTIRFSSRAITGVIEAEMRDETWDDWEEDVA